MNANEITLTTEVFDDKTVRLVERATDRQVIGGVERIVKSWIVVVEYSKEASSRHGYAGYQRSCVLFSDAADLFDEFVAAYQAA